MKVDFVLKERSFRLARCGCRDLLQIRRMNRWVAESKPGVELVNGFLLRILRVHPLNGVEIDGWVLKDYLSILVIAMSYTIILLIRMLADGLLFLWVAAA